MTTKRRGLARPVPTRSLTCWRASGTDTWVNQRWQYYDNTMQGYGTWTRWLAEPDLPTYQAKSG